MKNANKLVESIEDRPVITFSDADEWRKWLESNHESAAGVWIKIAKKATGIPTVTHEQALDDALCFGWIDGQRRSYNEQYFIQKFTPRTKRSIWSKRNQEFVARLIKEGRMRPAGQREIDVAKADGRWERAYDSPKNMKVPDDFLVELKKNKKAEQFFGTLNKTNTFSIAFQLATAKRPETRIRRMEKIIAMLEREEKLY
ncbi:MAG TPA: YdeI/OmpD-associated family protein [Candidatus Saccharimonadales bacterium]